MNKLVAAFKHFLDMVYMDECNCIACDKELKEKSRYGLCPECFKEMPLNTGKTCVKCGKPISDEAEYCMVCENSERFFDRVSSPLVYKGLGEKLILNYKFYNKRYLAKYLVSFLVDEYLDKGFNADLIIPVPVTEKVRNERGFSQTELLAEELGKRLKIEVNFNIAVKIKDTKHQAALSGKERQLNVLDAFKLKGSIKGRRVLLLDDILTTGATMSELAKAVAKGKPESIEGLTLANAEYKLYLDEQTANKDASV